MCAVRDGCSRRVIGWAIDEHMHTDLVQAALSMAVAMRGELADEVILHADRGCQQYTSAQLSRFARGHNLVRSVGRTAVCWDNAQAESFWGTLKVEFYDRYLWPTKAAAKLAVGDWIERVYNRRRRHSSIGMISPVDSNTDSLRRHKPPDPVSTKRGQAPCRSKVLRSRERLF